MLPKRVWNDENIDPESGGTLKDVQGRRVQQRRSLRNLNQNLERHLNANGNESRGSSPSTSVLEELDALSQDNCSSSEDDSHAVGEGHHERDCQQQEGGPVRCEICQVTVNSSHQLQAHLEGQQLFKIRKHS